MTYYIVFINRKEEFEWCVLATDDEHYAATVFDDIESPPEYEAELRSTSEDLATHRTFEVIKSK